MENLLLVTTTCSTKEEAQAIAQILLKERLVACAQITCDIESLYWWKGEIVKAREWLLTLKTHERLYPQLEEMIKKVHSYQTPEIVCTRLAHVESDYHSWLCDEVRKDDK